MCNLNILVKGNGVDLVNEFSHATAASFANNPHSEGIFFSKGKRMVKSEFKVPLASYREETAKSNFVIAHERIATSGYEMKNCQPFHAGRFVLVHNGILEIPSEEHPDYLSDTNVFFRNFRKEHKEHGDVKEAITNAMNKTGGGYYSIFIYDKKDKIGYYFKNSRANINVARLHRKAIVITTSESNLRFFNDVRKEYKIKNDMLYVFVVEKGIPMVYEGKRFNFKFRSVGFKSDYTRCSNAATTRSWHWNADGTSLKSSRGEKDRKIWRQRGWGYDSEKRAAKVVDFVDVSQSKGKATGKIKVPDDYYDSLEEDYSY